MPAESQLPHGTPGARRFSVAPMLDRTDRHFRAFARFLTRRALLYTEMITTSALLHGDAERLMAFDPIEKPLALQLGGSDPGALAQCARLAQRRGYDEVNLNVGCPSARVQNGRFGACLMTEPDLVAGCVAAMADAVTLPITVKTRIGVDDRDRYEDLCEFVETVARAGCRTFVVHARKAWLQGLSPKENREIPPLRYDVVERLKSDFPALDIVLNGGLTSLGQVLTQLLVFDGVMVGRAAYDDPYLLAAVDNAVFGESRAPVSRRECIESWLPYVERELASGTHLHAMSRHVLGLFRGVSGGRRWRRYLSEHASAHGAGVATLRAALDDCSLQCA
jgi:tRNA-dihydrouridine synthase A